MKTSLKTLLALGCAALTTFAAAQNRLPAFAELDDDMIEAAFWNCDTKAMRDVLSPGEGVLCERLTDALKQRRFGGDFQRFLDWWRDVKAAEYALRGVAAPSSTTTPADAADALALQAP